MTPLKELAARSFLRDHLLLNSFLMQLYALAAPSVRNPSGVRGPKRRRQPGGVRETRGGRGPPDGAGGGPGGGADAIGRRGRGQEVPEDGGGAQTHGAPSFACMRSDLKEPRTVFVV